MKIFFNSAIKSTFYPYYSSQKLKFPNTSFCGLTTDKFERSKEVSNYQKAKNLLSSTKKITPLEYRKLTPAQISAVNNYETKEAVDDNIAVALPLKDFLDKKYGKDKYVFVSIGTSPAPLGRVFEFSGVETKYLPISDLRYSTGYRDVVEAEYFYDYEKFLEEQGISKKNIEDSKKTFVFYDFTASGKTLRIFRDLMLKHLGLPEKQTDFRSLNEDILALRDEIRKIKPDVITDRKLLKKFNIKDPSFANSYIGNYLAFSESSKYGGIAHLDYRNFYQLNDAKNFESKSAKIYNLILIDELSKRGQLKQVSANSHCL